jgi:hypothetical protein
MKCLGLHNKPTAEVHLGHKLTGPKEEEEEEEEEDMLRNRSFIFHNTHSFNDFVIFFLNNTYVFHKPFAAI